MPRFEIIAEYLSEDIFEIEAETEEEAMKIFDNGEAGEGHNRDYTLNDILSCKEIKTG
jgi:hypothetical protein